jgi:S1-C subfamily serine protease
MKIKIGNSKSILYLNLALPILCFLVLNFSSVNVLANSIVSSTFFAEKKSFPLIFQTTVRLLGPTVSGSGVIVAHNGDYYSVLTCAHVIRADLEEQGFKIFTHDNINHAMNKHSIVNFRNLDLAVINFNSNTKYSVAPLSKSSIHQLGIRTYTAGYPSLIYQGGEWQLTHNMGTKNYFFDYGETTLILLTPLLDGYQIGLSNEVHQGMSGGPVFDDQLELIGIVGRTKYGGNRDFYQLSDGTYPSENLWEEMEDSSWAIPIYPILEKIIELRAEN